MSFPLTRPPSPNHEDHRSRQEVESLSRALHNALQTVSSHGLSHSRPAHDSADMPGKDKEKLPSLEIVVANDLLALKGTGVDVAPSLLTGHVILHLAESTSFKEITLQFRGKARLPPTANEPYVPAPVFNCCNII